MDSAPADDDPSTRYSLRFGLAFGAGSFVATWGYELPGKLQRSTDGKEWHDVMTGTPPFAGLAYGKSVFVAGGDPTSVSSDGKTWSAGGKLGFDVNSTPSSSSRRGTARSSSPVTRVISLRFPPATTAGSGRQPATAQRNAGKTCTASPARTRS